ncbi:MAG: YCF48-related protein [Desulfobaccales bacterium]
MPEGKTVTRKLLITIVGLILFNSLAFASWNTLTKDTPSVTLNADFFIDKNTGFAVGAAGTVLKTANAGGSFTFLAQGAAAINDVIFPSATEGYLLAAGKLYKSTDTGATFADITPAALDGYNFLKGGYSGNNRVFAAYPGTGTTSSLYSSTDGGATFSTASVADFEIYGATLTSDSTWAWGKTVSTGSYIIIKNNTTVYPTGSITSASPIRKVFFLDKDNGYAVGDSGLFLITTNGGGSWSDKTSVAVSAIGAAKNLKSVYFVTSQIGWAVGDNGTIIYTKDGGGSFSYYNPGSSGLDTAINLRDINIIFLTGNVIHAYVVGDNGHVYKLGSPAITAVAPTSKMQGWVGTVEVTGTDFASGLALAASGEGVRFFASTAESTTKASGVAIIDPAAALSAREITVTNPDLTTATSTTGVFTITANPGAVSISQVWFDKGLPDEQLYQPLKIPLNIVAKPTISFDVFSSAADLSTGTLNVKVLLNQNGTYTKLYSIPGSAATTPATNEAKVSFLYPGSLDTGLATIELYAEDSAGNVSREVLQVNVPPSSGNVVQGKKLFDVFPVPYKVDLESEDLILHLKSKIPVTLDQGATVLIYTAAGGAPAFSKSYAGPITDGSKITIPKRSLPAALQRVCIALVQILDNNTKKIVASGKFALVDKRYGM